MERHTTIVQFLQYAVCILSTLCTFCEYPHDLLHCQNGSIQTNAHSMQFQSSLFILQRLTGCHTKVHAKIMWQQCSLKRLSLYTVSHALFHKNSRLYTVYSPEYRVSSMLVIHSKHSHRRKINLIHSSY